MQGRGQSGVMGGIGPIAPQVCMICPFLQSCVDSLARTISIWGERPVTEPEPTMKIGRICDRRSVLLSTRSGEQVATTPSCLA